MPSLLWMLQVGVDDSHMTGECISFGLRRDALAALAGLEFVFPHKVAQVLRLEFGHDYSPATRVDVVARRTYQPRREAA